MAAPCPLGAVAAGGSPAVGRPIMRKLHRTAARPLLRRTAGAITPFHQLFGMLCGIEAQWLCTHSAWRIRGPAEETCKCIFVDSFFKSSTLRQLHELKIDNHVFLRGAEHIGLCRKRSEGACNLSDLCHVCECAAAALCFGKNGPSLSSRDPRVRPTRQFI